MSKKLIPNSQNNQKLMELAAKQLADLLWKHWITKKKPKSNHLKKNKFTF
jgi:hypothetical protein